MTGVTAKTYLTDITSVTAVNAVTDVTDVTDLTGVIAVTALAVMYSYSNSVGLQHCLRRYHLYCTEPQKQLHCTLMN